MSVSILSNQFPSLLFWNTWSYLMLNLMLSPVFLKVFPQAMNQKKMVTWPLLLSYIMTSSLIGCWQCLIVKIASFSVWTVLLLRESVSESSRHSLSIANLLVIVRGLEKEWEQWRVMRQNVTSVQVRMHAKVLQKNSAHLTFTLLLVLKDCFSKGLLK